MSKKLIEIAYHEAGHAISAFVFGKEFVEISVLPVDDYLGFVKYKSDRSFLASIIEGSSDEIIDLEEIDKMVRAELIIMLSGYCCELAIGIDNTQGARQDFESTITFAISHAGDGDSASELIDECLDASKKLLQDNWTLVELLVESLLEKKVLSANEVYQLLYSAQVSSN